MNHKIDLQVLLSQMPDKNQQITSFALLSLGVVESLASGTVSSSESVRLFFHAGNCSFVQKELRQKEADRIMSHGVQLQDLFEALPVEQAQQEFQRELGKMHNLCLEFLNQSKAAA